MKRLLIAAVVAIVLMAGAMPASAADGSMADGLDGWTVDPILTIGETIAATTGALNSTTAGDYTPAGVLDGLG
ncbi:MAG: hypothetical protein ACR2QO_27580, partial [Acidimicrobiales bacterium]